MTPRQIEVLDLVRELGDHGLTPTVRQIGERVGISSPSGVQRVLDALVREGRLERTPGTPRSLRVAGRPDLRLASTNALRAELARRGETLEALSTAEPRAYGGRASCAADTCGAAVQRGHLFCRTHWFRLPARLREDILAAFARRDTARYQELVAQARDIADGCGGAL